MSKHPSHVTRFSFDASTWDEICVNCNATDQVPGGWGKLAEPCPAVPEHSGLQRKLECLLASYDMDAPHAGDSGSKHYPGFTPEQFAEWIESPHSGDCTGLPAPCNRCYAEECRHQARWIVEQLGNMVSDRPVWTDGPPPVRDDCHCVLVRFNRSGGYTMQGGTWQGLDYHGQPVAVFCLGGKLRVPFSPLRFDYEDVEEWREIDA